MIKYKFIKIIIFGILFIWSSICLWLMYQDGIERSLPVFTMVLLIPIMAILLYGVSFWMVYGMDFLNGKFYKED